MPSRPLVGVPACARINNDWPVHSTVDKYVRAVVDGSGALPMLIPALGGLIDAEDLAARLDGLFLTGSPSNVEPRQYGGGEDLSAPPHDPMRDDAILPLIRACVRRGVPVFGVCRGLQEMNVAFGGTLHPRVHDVAGKMDHRGGPGTVEDKYRMKHTVRFTPGGVMERIAGKPEVMVNSLHGQGIDRLAAGLVVEGVAPDGMIEAVRVADAPAFALTVQWHPEYKFWEDPLSIALFAAFGQALTERAAKVGAAKVGAGQTG
jgi:putative glutamine amidotransferase